MSTPIPAAPSSPRSTRRGALALLAVATLLGCGEEREPVVSYTVPNESGPTLGPDGSAAPRAEAAAETPPAMPPGHPPIAGTAEPALPPLPAGHPPLDGTPTTAPALPMAAAEPEGETMAWTLPAGWSGGPVAGSMRFAELHAGEGDAAIEVAISRLVGGAGGLVANFNLWRQQVGLEPLPAEEIPEQVQPIGLSPEARGGFFDITGPAPATGAPGAAPRILVAVFPTRTHTWFIKAVGDAPTLERHREGFIDLCASVRFVEPAPPEVVSAPPPEGIAWGALPPGWSVDATPKTMAVASITLRTDEGEGSLTFTKLGGEQDLLANTNRWRRQVGLPEVPDLAATGAIPFTVSGAAGHLVDIRGDQLGIIGVVAQRGAETWFYKLSGPVALTASQRDAFDRFLATVRHEG